MSLQRFPDAVLIGIAKSHIKKPILLSRFCLGEDLKNRRIIRGTHLVSSLLLTVGIVRDRSDPACLVGNLKDRSAGLGGLLLRHGSSVHLKLTSVSHRIYFDCRCFSLAAVPRPALDSLGERPACQVRIIGAVHRCDTDQRSCLLSKSNQGICSLGTTLAGDIDTAVSAGHLCLGSCQPIIAVFGSAHAGLADIVHACPDKVAYHLRQLVGKLPEQPCIFTEGLRSEDQSVRIFFHVMAITPDSVVITGDVHVGVSTAGLQIAGIKCRAELHELVAHDTGQFIVELTADRRLFGFALLGFGGLRLFLGFLVAVHTKADRAQEVEENIDTAGDGPCLIQLVQILCHLSGKPDTLLLCGLGNFISGRIHDHGRMVVILVDHVCQVLSPPVLQECHIVISGLMHVPGIDELVHHQHAQPVAGIKDRFGAGVMRASECVVSVLLMQADLALFRFRKCTCTKQTIVMMNAGTAKNDPLTVDRHALGRIPCQSSDTEVLLHNIIPESYSHLIEIRVLGIPELCVRNGKRNVNFCLLAGICAAADNLITVQNFHQHIARL